MKKKYSILLILIFAVFLGCSKNDKKSKKITVNTSSSKPIVEEKEDTITRDSIKVTASETVILTKNPKLVATEKPVTVKNNIPTLNHEVKKTETKKPVAEPIISFTNIRKILSDCKVGQTLTRNELIKNYNIPEEAFKLVKSISKVAEDEIAIKWNSTWFVEKVSDAEFANASMKVKFEGNKMYTSGKAIGIKYNRKTYHNLVIIGNSAYIPSVKGYHWEIGKNGK